MSVQRSLLTGRLALVRKDLEEVLTNVTADDLDWAPKSGMRTIGGQIAEIVATEGQFNEVFTGKPFDFGGRYEEVKAISDLSEILEVLAATRRLTLNRLSEAAEEFLSESIPIDPTWFESGGLASLPRIEILQALPMHEWYHTGQLVSYMWIKGFNPYDSAG